MLNLVTFDKDDQALLENSFDAIKQKDILAIVEEGDEKKKIFDLVINSLKIPTTSQLSFQNLFKLSSTKASFYIAQCLIDFNYSGKAQSRQNFDHKYEYCAIGIANMSIDLGSTELRPENKLDKIINRFINHDIDFDNAEKFSDKYYLISNKKDMVRKYFDQSFINTIARYDDILLSVKNDHMFVSFTGSLQINQCRIIEDILGSCKFISL
jgi:hypothetical protein